MSRRSTIRCRCGRQTRNPVEVHGLLLCRECAFDELPPIPTKGHSPRPDFRYIPPSVRRTG